ncbi:MAG: ribosome silencing factor [Treponema sp.]|jgi:ribosome-associated protein|nr:ribosome silencing factor [Treponema sp.]
MADMLPEIKEQAESLAGLIKEHRGENVSLLDLRTINNWTDFFIIATASSKTHMDGMERHIKDYCRENDIEIFGSSKKDPEDEWRLIDLGFTVVHLMTAPTRDFYDLERLWHHSSKSSSSSQSSSSSS